MLRKISKSGFKYLSILGGEPLICEGLDEILHEAKNCGLTVFITTNGTLMNDDVVDILLKNEIYTILVSLEGPTEQSNDIIRGTGSFKKATENLKKLTSRIKRDNLNIVTGISTTLTKSNMDELIKMPKLANDLGVQKLVFSSFVERVNIRNYTELKGECDSGYFSSFVNVKKMSTNRSTCQECDLKDICTPCPVQLMNIDKIEECEYIMKKEKKYHYSLLKEIPIINDNVVYKEFNDGIVLWDSTNMRFEKFDGIRKEIIKLIIESKSINEIVLIMSAKYNCINRKNDIFNFLLDLRVGGYLSF